MLPSLPQGSGISVTGDGVEDVIVIPQAHAGIGRSFAGAFLLFWLGGWYLGFTSVVSKIVSGQAPAFMYLWLGGWTIGGLFAATMLYRLIRPSVPETLRLRQNGLSYDSGVAPLNMQPGYGRGYASRREAWSSMFPKRTVIDVDRRALASLRLRESDSGNRLTLDVGASRLDIGAAASEIEREWLYRALSERYRLSRSQGDSALN